MKVTSVTSARKPQGQCQSCKKDINAGDPYRWWKFRYGGRRIRCMAFSCNPKPQDLTQNEILIAMYDVMESASDLNGLEDWDEVSAAGIDIAEMVRSEVCALIQWKMDNIEQGFGHTSTPAYESLEETLGMAEGWADGIDSEAWDYDAEGEELLGDFMDRVRDRIEEGF